MLPLDALDPAAVRGLVGVLCDVDDTLTWRGRIVPEAFVALARLHAAGLRVVPVTGRPAGWVDHMARAWPVDGVVGENGGLWFWHDGQRLRRGFAQPAEERAAHRSAREAVAARILDEVPGTALASDQPYRELDVAIDFCEDVPALDDRSVDAIVARFRAVGATCKVSSIHVNGWFGSFDKLAGVRAFVAARWQEPVEPDRWLFVGDSANDEPMFAFFPHAVGVANVARFLPRMRAHPRYVTPSPGGAGFAELAAHILALRA